jgi:DNA-binding MarR family transcriptional regulator
VAGTSKRAAQTAVELMTAMTRLRARLRAESPLTDMAWNWSQLNTLARLVTEGPATTTELAQAEHVRRQSMAETITALRADGLVDAEPDPADGRKTLIYATARGRSLAATFPAAREAWLSTVIAGLLDPAEQQTLLKAAAIMNRLADSNMQEPGR